MKYASYSRISLPQDCVVRDWYPVLASVICTFGLIRPIQVRRIPGTRNLETVRQEDHETILALELLNDIGLFVSPEQYWISEYLQEIPIKIVKQQPSA